jgi:hypothetical protein
VATELACDWHTVNDAVGTYGKALLEADRGRLAKTTAIGLDETSFVKAGARNIGFWFGNVDNYRIRVLLYAVKTDWRALGPIVVR